VTPATGTAAARSSTARPRQSARPRPPSSTRTTKASARKDAGLRIAGRQISISTVLLMDVVLLCIVGLVMVGSASGSTSISIYGSAWAIFIREVMWMAIGGIVLAFAIRFDYHKLRRIGPLLLIGSFALLLVVLEPSIGHNAQGSSRWVGVGQLRIQPSELMKLALTIFLADFITRRLDRDSTDRRIIGPVLLVAGAACVLILAQPDMGTAMVLGLITLALLFVSGVRLGPVMKVMGVVVALAIILGLSSSYRRARLMSFIDPSAHGTNSGYQVLQSLIGLGSGHVFGTGVGGGQAQWGYLPNAHTDFIFSVIGEQLGIVGALFVLALLVGFMWLGIRASTSSRDHFGALLALGLVAWTAAETVINIGAVLGFLPVTGIPLPFISFGGSSLVITMAASGILINVARQGEAGATLRAVPRSGGSTRAAKGGLVGRAARSGRSR
jgi:cell division protein FtsW